MRRPLRTPVHEPRHYRAESPAQAGGLPHNIVFVEDVCYSVSVAEPFVTKEELAAAVSQLATKQDLAHLQQVMTAQLQQGMADMESRLTEAIRDAQTEALRAFYNWARPVELRLNRTDEVAQRLSWIEERIAALERGRFPSTH